MNSTRVSINAKANTHRLHRPT